MDVTGYLLYKSNMEKPDPSSILNCNLFGEAGDLPDVVHCETIETRSKLHDWELVPHRHARLHQVLLIEAGGGRATLEDDAWPLGPHTLVNVPTGAVHGFSFTPGTEGWVVTIASEMMDETLEPSEGLRHALARPAVFPADSMARPLMQQIFTEHAGRGYARAQILRSLTGVLLGRVARGLSDDGIATGNPDGSGLFRRFETLVEEHFLEHWSVADYAKALSVSPTHLSRVTRAAIGQPASRVIEDRMIREARRNLVYTNLPVSRIAYALGYNDPAYFSRVFSQATGMAPRDFRERVGGTQGAAA
ncbi:helix-turn-helix domain-containing protein [Oricola thermophila]|uniref:Helix-turn-helix domain-containing protein n=1 Tax=Oricola thermophila TaxID=2742145 RepID=A0A6N1VFG0_9HYPH|nr:helix-turn-helix domain-containing protein [Oricola thermophila]QKV17879.1 helix-turn-helix domain-containing protein [Oricola thermophila]